MSEPNPSSARSRFGIDDLRPAARRPWWQRLLPSLLVTAPALALVVVELVELFRTPEPQQMSASVGIALCVVWLHVLLRTVIPLAQTAWWLDGGFAAVAAVLLLQRLDVGAGWIVAGACAASAVMLALQRPRRPTLPASPSTRMPRVETSSTVAFSESSANGGRAALIVVGCAAAVGFGIFTVVTVGATGWWYFLAALVWLTGSVPWMLRVTLDRTGFAVRSLLLPGSLVRIPLGDVAELRAGIAHTRHWGGPGSIHDRGTTSILRADGGALLVTCTDGTQVVVNVERPDEAMAVYRELCAGGEAP